MSAGIDKQPARFGEHLSMAEKVVTLYGPPRHEPGKANQTVVEELERLLEAARSGEIVGMAGAYTHRNRIATYSFAGSVGGYALIGGLECVKARLTRMAVE
jgi:hypothetical protein